MKNMRFIWFVGALALLALSSAVVMVLWNWLLPAIGAPVITYARAVGILVLSRILFGGFGTARLLAGGVMGRDHRNPLREKWDKMSDDERWEFIRKNHERGGFFRGGRGGNEQGTTGRQSRDGSAASTDATVDGVKE